MKSKGDEVRKWSSMYCTCFLFWEKCCQSSLLQADPWCYQVFHNKGSAPQADARWHVHKIMQTANLHYCPRAYFFALEDSKVFLFGIAFVQRKNMDLKSQLWSFVDVGNLEYDRSSGWQWQQTINTSFGIIKHGYIAAAPKNAKMYMLLVLTHVMWRSSSHHCILCLDSGSQSICSYM